MASRWERSEAVVAQRMSARQMAGILGKRVRILDGEKAILEEDGGPLSVLDSGEHKVAGAFGGSGRSVAFFDVSRKTVRRELRGLWTRDDREIIGDVELDLVVSDAGKLRAAMMQKRDLVTLEDIWQELSPDLAGSAVGPVVKKRGVDQLQSGGKAAKELQVSAELGLRKRLELMGITLVSFSIGFRLPEDYREFMKRRATRSEAIGKEKGELEEEVVKAVREREAGTIRGAVQDREKALDDMEDERIRREAELGIEEEENQEDMRDASEALRLKRIKDRQKDLREAERKSLGLEPGANEAVDLRGRYRELEDAIKATERKYLNRKIGEEAFRKLMEGFEKEKTMLEVKMKGGKR